MVLYEIDGRVAVGVQTFGRNGCAELVARTHDSVIDVRGVRYPSERGGACTGAITRFWEELPLPRGTSDLTVRYRGRAGTYRFEHAATGVGARYVRGDDVAPLMAERWWQVPEDIVAVHVWYGTQAAVRDVSERVHDRLLDEGANIFVRPAGVPIVPATHPADGREALDEWWSEIAAAGQVSVSRRVYLSSLEPETLQRIATDESAREGCGYVQMIRRNEWLGEAAVRATPRCASS